MDYYGSFEEEPRQDPRKNKQWVEAQRKRSDEQERQKQQQYDEESKPDYDPWTGSYY